MRLLRASADPDSFFERLAAARARVLFLDYDGTIAPFRPDRENAIPYPGVGARLGRLIGAGSTRLVVVSGRWSRDLLPLLALDPPPEIWGCHGWERLRPGRQPEIGTVDEAAVRGLVRADEWGRAAKLGGRLERKPASVALHWRGLSPEDREALRARSEPAWIEIARSSGLELRRFDGGIELLGRGRDKGTAVRAVLEEEGSHAAAAYLGDDLTDEDGFRALAGKGLRVLVREEPRPSEADVWIRPPGELLLFLDRWLRAAGQEVDA